MNALASGPTESARDFLYAPAAISVRSGPVVLASMVMLAAVSGSDLGRPAVHARANPDDGTIVLHWTAVPGAIRYQVERAAESAGAIGAFAVIAPAQAGTELVDTGVQPNTRSWYRVRATGAAGDGPYSQTVSVVAVSRWTPAAPGRNRDAKRFRGMQMRGHGPLSPEADTRLTAPGALEGRGDAADASPLQARIDAAARDEAIEVGPGDYRGDLYIDRPVRLVGRQRPRLLGSGHGSVVRIRAAGVVVEGFDIEGPAGDDLAANPAGVHVAAADVVVRDCRISGTPFGVYLREAAGARVEGNVIRGDPGKPASDKGSGIHVWNSSGFLLEGNDIAGTRDAVYLQESSKGSVRKTRSRNVRYGVHVMACDDDVLEDNDLADSVAGAVLMFSNRIQVRRNRITHHRELTSVGVLTKDLHESMLEDNLIGDNSRGILIETSWKTVFRRNLVAESDVAVQVYGGCLRTRFEGNSFVGNTTPVSVFTQFGGAPESFFEGNYWSENDQPDLDGDGRSDRGYALGSPFDLFRRRISTADLLAQSPAALALAAAGRAFPVFDVRQASDSRPLARPPVLRDVPAANPGHDAADPGGIAVSLALAALGVALLRAGRGGEA